MTARENALNFFNDCRFYFEGLLKGVSKKEEIKWYHKILGTKPRNMKYQEIVQKCDHAIEALGKEDFETVGAMLFGLINFYESEIKKFSKFCGKYTLRSLKELKSSFLDLRRSMLSAKLKAARDCGEAEITDILHDPKCYLCALKKLSRDNSWDLRCHDCSDALSKAIELREELLQNLSEEQVVLFRQYVKIMEHFCIDQVLH